MENILKREADLEHSDFDDLKYNLNSSNSEYDNMEIEEDITTAAITVSDRIKDDHHNNIDDVDMLNIKKESVLDFSSEIILPQASQSQSLIPQKMKKEVKTKKEIEEEEREKMQ